MKTILVALMLLIMLPARSLCNTGTELLAKPMMSIKADDLLNKLVTNANFRNYYTRMVAFSDKIIETKSGVLFNKFLRQTITPDEQNQFIVNMSFENKAALDNFALSIRSELVGMNTRIPELANLNEKEKKQLFFEGLKQLSDDKSITVRFTKPLNITLSQCFYTWMICIASCAICCQENYWECFLVCEGIFGICWAFAEL